MTADPHTISGRWAALSAPEKVGVVVTAPLWVPFFAFLSLFVLAAMAMEAVERLLFGDGR